MALIGSSSRPASSASRPLGDTAFQPVAPASTPTDSFQAAAALQQRGCLLEEAGDWLGALACYQEAATLEPAAYGLWLDIGVVLTRLQRFDEAEAAYQRAIALQPDQPAAWSNLGALLAALRRDADAEACCVHALSLDPNYRKARLNLAYLLLRQGRLAEGQLCHEARDGLPDLERKLQTPRWNGDALNGQSLLIVSDAGYGDMLQMARYADVLRARGARRLVLHCPPALKRLMEYGMRGSGFDCVVGYDEPLYRSTWDLWTPSMSLPHLCGTRLDDLPGRAPYLAADAERVAYWRQALRADDTNAKTLVGVVWHGNPRHDFDAYRSLPSPALLAPLAQVEHARFIDLQFDAHPTSAASRWRIEPFPGARGDFYETAATVAALDLVITVDTSIAHLTGALGKPVWVMLSDHMTDSRWLNERTDSPWYPDVMRLFRQTRRNEWDAVVDDVTQALRAWSPYRAA